MNAVTKIEQAPSAQPKGKKLIEIMAMKANMEPEAFGHTVRSTVMPKGHNNEQFAALMLVAHEYGLNPIVKEIYAFPAKGGGIVPIVSIDGWVNLVNSHPQCNGFTFEWEHDADGKLISCTCKMYRKDRDHPVEVTEYLEECKRSTEPWKMQHRMLRHKAMIQAARYAFGFSGIYDEDEGARISAAEDTANGEAQVLEPPAPPPSDESVGEAPAQTIDHEVATALGTEEFFTAATEIFANCDTVEELVEAWDGYAHIDLSSDDEQHLHALYDDRLAEIAEALEAA